MWRYARRDAAARRRERRCRSAKGSRRCTTLPKLAREIGVARLWVKDEGLNPDGVLQGARHERGGHARARARCVGARRADRRQRRRGARPPTVRPPGLPVRVYAPEYHAEADSRHDSRARRRPAARARPHRRRGQDRRARSRRRAGTSTSRRCASRIASKGRRRWASSSPSNSAGDCPTHIIYPTGGGTGLIGMWKVFAEMREGGWLPTDIAMPHMIVAQADRLRADGARVRRRTPIARRRGKIP